MNDKDIQNDVDAAMNKYSSQNKPKPFVKKSAFDKPIFDKKKP
jgi:hypothetical protein